MRPVPRPDVIAALETLSDVERHERWARGESTWPDLDNAIHWLVDDTGLDLAISGSVDLTIFRSEAEAGERDPVDVR